jgi:hypothetical protein
MLSNSLLVMKTQSWTTMVQYVIHNTITLRSILTLTFHLLYILRACLPTGFHMQAISKRVIIITWLTTSALKILILSFLQYRLLANFQPPFSCPNIFIGYSVPTVPNELYKLHSSLCNAICLISFLSHSNIQISATAPTTTMCRTLTGVQMQEF